MQTVSGTSGERRLRTGSPENSIATTRSSRTQQPRSVTAECASSDSGPMTTKAGKIRQRMKWTMEMNECVMRCYYKATKVETINSGYRPQLLHMFKQEYPHMNITEQRLMDQKRTIINNNRIPQNRIQKIKEEIAQQLNEEEHQTIPDTQPLPISPQPNIGTNTANADINDTRIHTQINKSPNSGIPEYTQRNRQTDQIVEQLREQYAHWSTIEPKARPRLPKLKINKKINELLETVNQNTLTLINNNTPTLQEIHTITYTAASTTILLNKQKPITNYHKKNGKPNWLKRIENKIDTLRKDAGRLTQYIAGNRSTKILRNISHIINNTEIEPQNHLDTIKQKISVYSTRRKRYKDASDRKRQNNLFYNNQKSFYKGLNRNGDVHITTPPKKMEIEEFWNRIWNDKKTHNDQAPWIKEEENEYAHIDNTREIEITKTDITTIIKKLHNWKAPGIDAIHNFWYKKLTQLHEPLAQAITQTINSQTHIPRFLTEGVTYIKPKDTNTQDPSNYRPITCLPTLYKIITATVTQKIEEHLRKYNILTEEQKGCRKNSQGCKEQLTIDAVIMKQAQEKNRNLYTCYIDYRKAFDSVPHSWLIKTLEIYRIPQPLINLLKRTMQSWRTSIHLHTNNTKIETHEIPIRRGIFQGDTLSATWFCMCVNPLSRMLNTAKYGFEIKNRTRTTHTINHLMYMDDIKLYAKTVNQIQQLIKITENISTDIQMEFGLQKCKTLRIEKGKWATQEEIEIDNQKYIGILLQDETYKYLGIPQNTKINHKQIKTNLTQQYTNRLRAILQTKLNATNITKAINTYAIPILTYSFGIIKWTETDTEQLNRTTRTMLTKYKMHHPKAAIERVTLPRNTGGRGLINITHLHKNQINNLQTYFHEKKNHSPLHDAIVKADQKYTPLNLAQIPIDETQTINQTDEAQKLARWTQKEIHGRHRKVIQQPHIDKKQTYNWLIEGQLHPTTEGFAIAIQDQVIATKNYKKHIMKDTSILTDACRRCHIQPETIDHITSGCKLLAGTDYTHRHNTIAKIIHQEIAQKHNLVKHPTPYFKYKPETILENQMAKIYWDTTLHTDRTTAHNRPDITYMDKETKTTYLIDITVPNDANTKIKEEEKINKYTPLAIEIKEIWKQEQVKIIPIIIGVTGVTPKSLTENIKKIGININIQNTIQRVVIIETCAIVRKFLNPPT